MPSKIEWTGETWNPITGCTPISPGCEHCYARRMATRLAGRCGYDADDPFRVTIHTDRFGQPAKWKMPRMVFVCSMGDLFHADVPTHDINRVYDVMETIRRHTYQVLTKRPERMRDYLQWRWGVGRIRVQNIWHGVTAENQEQANKRIPALLDTPSAVWFVSIEPMLEPVDLRRVRRGVGCLNAFTGRFADCDGHLVEMGNRLDWVIVGGETGPGARPMNPDWARAVRDQCSETGVPFFFKKMGSDQPTPSDLAIPRAAVDTSRVHL